MSDLRAPVIERSSKLYTINNIDDNGGGFPKVMKLDDDVLKTTSTNVHKTVKKKKKSLFGQARERARNARVLPAMVEQPLQQQQQQQQQAVKPKVISTLPNSNRAKISEENTMKLNQMTESEIALAQKEIEQLLPADVLSYFRKNTGDSNESVTPSSTGISVEEKTWMSPVEEEENLNVPSGVSGKRFDFNGLVVNSTIDVSTSVAAGLHHHGNAPGLAGYTYDELKILARSIMPPQRAMALQILSKIVCNVHDGHHSVDLFRYMVDEGELVVLTGAALDDPVMTVGALTLLHAVLWGCELGPHVLECEVNQWAHRTKSHQIVEHLMKMNVTEMLCRILLQGEALDELSTTMLYSILRALALQSCSVRRSLARNPRLMAALRKHAFDMHRVVRGSIVVLMLVCETSVAAARLAVPVDEFERTARFVLVWLDEHCTDEQVVQLATETLELWCVFLKLGLYARQIADFVPIMTVGLRAYLSDTLFRDAISSVLRVLAALVNVAEDESNDLQQVYPIVVEHVRERLHACLGGGDGGVNDTVMVGCLEYVCAQWMSASIISHDDGVFLVQELSVGRWSTGAVLLALLKWARCGAVKVNMVDCVSSVVYANVAWCRSNNVHLTYFSYENMIVEQWDRTALVRYVNQQLMSNTVLLNVCERYLLLQLLISAKIVPSSLRSFKLWHMGLWRS